MKICVLSFTGLDTDGKDATRILKEIRSLANAGHTVKAIGLRIRQDLPQNEIYYGVEIQRIKPAFFGFDRSLQRETQKRTLFGSIRRLYVLAVKNTLGSSLALIRAAFKDNSDSYHCFGSYSLVPGFIIKIFKRKMVIYDSYEPAPTLVSRIRALGIFAKMLSRVVEFVENRMVSRIDCVLTIPSAGDRIAERFRKYNRNTIVLENVPEFTFGTEDSVRGQSRIELSSNRKSLFYMGALTRDKGIIKMIETMRLVKEQVDDVKLVIAGAFSEDKSYDNPDVETMELIEKYALQDSIVFLGFVPRNEIFTHMISTDIVLQLYQPIAWFTESKASSSFFEYMAASLPIVTSDFPGFRSIIEENKCGLTVDPTDPNDAAEKVIYLLSHPEISREMGKNGRLAFESKYNWDIEEHKLLEVYSKLEEKLRK